VPLDLPNQKAVRASIEVQRMTCSITPWQGEEIVMSHRSLTSSSNANRAADALSENTSWLSPKQVCEMFSISEATLYRWVKSRPEFPKTVKFSPGCTRFSLVDLNAFIRSLAGR
jgi:prophage regulatory protein